MYLKENKGITLIVLTITIIVLLIIAGITIYAGSNLIQEAKVEDVKTNLLLVQAEAKKYVEQAKFENKTIDVFLSENGFEVEGNKLKLEQVTENGQTYYKIVSPMSELNLSKLEPEKYLLSINIDEVNAIAYFVPGIKNENGQICHLLSEMP